jgi:peptidyl-prolyl cis-trans isomerase SurA
VTYLKKIIPAILILLISISQSNSIIKDSLFVTIGNKAVTHSDIVREIKIILIVNGQNFSEESRKSLHAAALQSLIKRNVKKIEIEKFETLEFNQSDLQSELNRLASNLNLDFEAFKNIFIRNGIDFSAVEDNFRTELLWNTLIFSIYNKQLSVNLEEIEEQLILVKQKTEVEELFLSEIVIKPVAKDKTKNEVDKIKNRIKSEGFEKVAMNLSISKTALAGGNLGWISENIIAKNFKSTIIKTSIGQVSEPIFLPTGIFFFKVKDKRKIKQITDLEKVKDQLITVEKNKILQMHSLSHYDGIRRTIAINYY